MSSARDLEDLLMDVDGIGPATAETIADEFDGVAELREVVTDLPDGYSPTRLSGLDGFGPSRARTVATTIAESGVLEERAEESSAHARRIEAQLRMDEDDDGEDP